MNTDNYGKIFKRIREGKNISVKFVADEKISSAQLYLFERGQTDISLSKFRYIIHKIGISLEEFEELANDYNIDNNYYERGKKLVQLSLDQNVMMLQEILEKQESRFSYQESDIEMSFYLLIKCILSTISDDNLLTRKDYDYLNDYIISINEWGYYQLLLFKETIFFLNLDLVISLSKELVSLLHSKQSNDRYRQIIIATILHASGYCAKNGKMKIANFFLNTIKKVLDEEETFLYEKLSFCFTEGIVDYYSGNEELAIPKMLFCIQMLKGLGQKKLAILFESFYYRLIR